MEPAREALPDDVPALKAALAAERAQKLAIEAELTIARAKASEDMALIAQQKLRIAKLERQVYGQRSERSARPIEQLALKFEELEASATEDELAAERAVAETTNVRGFTRRPAERNTFPEHLPRERVVIDPPKRCECCGGLRLRKLGEDVARTLETEPRRWKVIRPCGRSFPAGTARRSPSPLLRTMSSQEGQAPRRDQTRSDEALADLTNRLSIRRCFGSMPIYSGGSNVCSSAFGNSREARELGWPVWSEPRRTYLLTGHLCMRTSERWEPYESRGNCPAVNKSEV